MYITFPQTSLVLIYLLVLWGPCLLELYLVSSFFCIEGFKYWLLVSVLPWIIFAMNILTWCECTSCLSLKMFSWCFFFLISYWNIVHFYLEFFQIFNTLKWLWFSLLIPIYCFNSPCSFSWMSVCKDLLIWLTQGLIWKIWYLVHV